MGKKKFYAVRAPASHRGLYASWDECKAHVVGIKGAQFKGFETKAQADTFMGGSNVDYGAKSKEKKPAKPKSQEAVSTSKSINRESVLIYTDGSCLGNNNVAINKCPAGWGAVAITNCAGTEQFPADSDSAHVLARLYGPVLLDPTHPQYLGAEVGSNNTGELTAIGEALKWVDTCEAISEGAAVVIRYDSKYAANIANGTWTAHKNTKLAESVQALHKKCTKKRRIAFSHVKGHSNHMWNDEADRLANKGGTGLSSYAVSTGSSIGGSIGGSAGGGTGSSALCDAGNSRGSSTWSGAGGSAGSSIGSSKREAPEMIPLVRNKKARVEARVGGHVGGHVGAHLGTCEDSLPAASTIAAEAEEEWPCAVCTLLNPALFLACSACGSQRAPSELPSSRV
jgi:ribonuclease HI